MHQKPPSSLQDVFTCKQCGLIFDDPKVLPCGDSLCFKCLKSVDFHVKKCFKCGESHELSATNLTSNPKLIEYMNLYKAELMRQQQQQTSTAATSRAGSKSLTGSTTHLYDTMENNARSATLPSGARNRVQSQPPCLVNLTSLAAPSMTCLSRGEMNVRLETYMKNLESKVDLINNGYERARAKIEFEFNKISDEVNEAARLLIVEINRKRETMLKDIDSYKEEMLFDYSKRFSVNQNFENLRRDVNTEFERVKNEMSTMDARTCDPERMRYVLQKLEKLNATINDHQRMLPDPEFKVGLSFAANAHPLINVPFIGDITYDSIYKIDVKSKIDCFNNDYQHRVFDFSGLIGEHPVSKNIGLVSKNKFLVIYEKILGKIKVTYAKIVYYDGSILAECTIADVGNFLTYLIYDKYILMAFKKNEKQCILHVMDLNLVQLKDAEFDYNISYMLMNDEHIYVIAEKSPIINEYDLELNYRGSWGQVSKPKKPFFVKDEIIAINAEKIFVRFDGIIRLICRSTGTVLYTVDKIDELNKSTVFLDYNKEKYIVFNGHDKVVYYNHKGEVIASNKLRGIKERIDEFQFSRSGHFAFINYDFCKVLVI